MSIGNKLPISYINYELSYKRKNKFLLNSMVLSLYLLCHSDPDLIWGKESKTLQIKKILHFIQNDKALLI